MIFLFKLQHSEIKPWKIVNNVNKFTNLKNQQEKILQVCTITKISQQKAKQCAKLITLMFSFQSSLVS
jgi:hypothetical protein